MSDYHVAVAEWDRDRSAIAEVRRRVFIDEQQVPEALEWDGQDADCDHVLARDAAGAPIGTARMTPGGHIGRLAVLAGWRNRGVGSRLLEALIERARARGIHEVVLNAQTRAVGFYEARGFRAEGQTFMDAGIPHRRMRRDIERRHG